MAGRERERQSLADAVEPEDAGLDLEALDDDLVEAGRVLDQHPVARPVDGDDLGRLRRGRGGFAFRSGARPFTRAGVVSMLFAGHGLSLQG